MWSYDSIVSLSIFVFMPGESFTRANMLLPESVQSRVASDSTSLNLVADLFVTIASSEHRLYVVLRKLLVIKWSVHIARLFQGVSQGVSQGLGRARSTQPKAIRPVLAV